MNVWKRGGRRRPRDGRDGRRSSSRIGAGHGEGRRRPARQLGHDDRRGRPAARDLPEARPRPRDPVDTGRRRNPAGGDLRQRRRRRRARDHGRAVRLLEGCAGAHHRRADQRRVRHLLVRPGELADQDAQGHRGQDDRLLDQRFVDARCRHRVHEAVRPQGQADRHRWSGADADAGHVRADRCRLGGAAVRPPAARRRQDPEDRHRRRRGRLQGPDRAPPHHQRTDAAEPQGGRRALHEGVSRDDRRAVLERSGGAADVRRLHGHFPGDGEAHARRVLPQVGGRSRPDHRHRCDRQRMPSSSSTRPPRCPRSSSPS